MENGLDADQLAYSTARNQQILIYLLKALASEKEHDSWHPLHLMNGFNE